MAVFDAVVLAAPHGAGLGGAAVPASTTTLVPACAVCRAAVSAGVWRTTPRSASPWPASPARSPTSCKKREEEEGEAAGFVFRDIVSLVGIGSAKVLVSIASRTHPSNSRAIFFEIRDMGRHIPEVGSASPREHLVDYSCPLPLPKDASLSAVAIDSAVLAKRHQFDIWRTTPLEVTY
ncbi:hypothetical protein C2845_PM15G14000 [Panicum miliaceum]|uniref:Uncharacterized protein n=1 Tax=Panicum miliaceum TaxID=4540 RepID=A0A3L6QBP5_PANMI|nr:hypothetical protein C2845_PM15G14000 [Panicum miliaceum]